jgi:hypothetical protein
MVSRDSSMSRDGKSPTKAIYVLALRTVGFALGAVLIVLSLATGRIGLVAGRPGQAMTVLIALGLFLILAAAAGRSFRRHMKTASIVLLGSIVAFALLELIATLLLRPGLGGASAAPQGASLLPGARDWIECPYAPLTVWTASETSRSAEEAFHASEFEGEDTLNILLYGGSDVWSAGVHDSLRIRSLLRRYLESGLQRPVMVRDRSAPYFNSTQALLSLLISLRDGERPDFVLMLLGSDEVLAGLESGAPGLHRGIGEIRRRMDDTTGTLEAGFTLALLARVAATSSVYRLGTEAFSGSGPGDDALPFPLVEDPGMAFQLQDTLPTALARSLAGTCEVLDALSTGYGFGYAVVALPSYSSPPNPGAATDAQREAWPDSTFFLLQSYLRGEIARWYIGPHMLLIEMSIGDSNWVMVGRSVVCKPGQNRAVAEAVAGQLLARPEWLSR